MWEDTHLVHRYTRAQAIEDGVLVQDPLDLLAMQYGIKFPCAMTAGLYETLVPREGDVNQDITGRLWDMLTVFKYRAKDDDGSLIHFHFYVQRRGKLTKQEVKVVCGPGDEGEPVITFMLPEED